MLQEESQYAEYMRGLDRKERQERKREKRERVVVEEKFERPWEELELKEEIEWQEKIVESWKLNKETQGACESFLSEIAEEKRGEFAQEWFKEHQQELKEKIPSVSQMSEKMRIEVAVDNGAFKELRTKGEYREKHEEIENLNTMRLSLSMGRMKLETPILILDQLNKKTERIKEEIKEMQRRGESPGVIEIKEKKLGNLLKTRKELAEKISGQDLEKEALKSAEGHPLFTDFTNKDNYVKENIESRLKEVLDKKVEANFRKEWDSLSDEEKEKYQDGPLFFADGKLRDFRMRVNKFDKKGDIKDGTLWTLMAKGYKPEDIKVVRRVGNLWRKKIWVKTEKKELLLSKKKFKEGAQREGEDFLKKLEGETRKDLAKEWEKGRQDALGSFMEERIGLITKDLGPDKVKEMSQRLRKEVLAEFIEKDLKKDEKTAEQLREIKKNFEKKGIKTTEFISAANSKQEELNNPESLRDFLGEYGIRTSEENIDNFIKGYPNYQKVLRQERGFLMVIFSLIFELIFGGSKK